MDGPARSMVPSFLGRDGGTILIGSGLVSYGPTGFVAGGNNMRGCRSAGDVMRIVRGLATDPHEVSFLSPVLATLEEAACISVSEVPTRSAAVSAQKWAERVPQQRFAVSALPRSLLTLRRYDSVRWSGELLAATCPSSSRRTRGIVVAGRFRIVVVTLDDDVGEAGSVQHQE
jgi:hypothetical protein